MSARHPQESMAPVSGAAVSASSSGDNTIVAAVSGKVIRVISGCVMAGGAVSATWKSGAATSLSGAMPLPANGGYTMPEATVRGHFETAAGEALVLGLSSAVLVAGWIRYQTIG